AARGRRPARPRASPAEPALRRAAAARRNRAGARQRALPAARRRADRQPRLAVEHRDHGSLRAPPPGAARHDHPGHARAPHRRVHPARRHLPRRADRVGPAAGGITAHTGDRTRMNLIWMSVVTALRALRRNVLRSALTMLGVIIGVAAVVTMVSIGRGANAAVQQEIQSLGNNLVMIIPGATTVSGVRTGSGSAASLTVADATAIAKECPAVSEVAWAKDQDAVVLIPFLTAERRVLGTQILGTVDMIVAAAATADVLPKVEPQIRALLRERHRIPSGQDDDFTVRDLNEIAEASKNA